MEGTDGTRRGGVCPYTVIFVGYFFRCTREVFVQIVELCHVKSRLFEGKVHISFAHG